MPCGDGACGPGRLFQRLKPSNSLLSITFNEFCQHTTAWTTLFEISGRTLLIDRRRDCGGAQYRASGAARGRDQRLFGAADLVEMIQDGAAVDDSLTVIQNEYRHFANRIERSRLLRAQIAIDILVRVGNAAGDQ